MDNPPLTPAPAPPEPSQPADTPDAAAVDQDVPAEPGDGPWRAIILASLLLLLLCVGLVLIAWRFGPAPGG